MGGRFGPVPQRSRIVSSANVQHSGFRQGLVEADIAVSRYVQRGDPQQISSWHRLAHHKGRIVRPNPSVDCVIGPHERAKSTQAVSPPTSGCSSIRKREYDGAKCSVSRHHDHRSVTGEVRLISKDVSACHSPDGCFLSVMHIELTDMAHTYPWSEFCDFTMVFCTTTNNHMLFQSDP